jgi:hypothetical protein
MAQLASTGIYGTLSVTGNTTINGTLSVTGNITLYGTVTFSNIQTGIQYSTTHWMIPKDTSGNTHIKADTGGIYLDGSIIHLRNATGGNDVTVASGTVTATLFIIGTTSSTTNGAIWMV